jgi:hypothetical protein
MVWYGIPPSQVRMAVQKMLEEGLNHSLPFLTPKKNPGMFLIRKPDMLQWLDRFDAPDQISLIKLQQP